MWLLGVSSARRRVPSRALPATALAFVAGALACGKRVEPSGVASAASALTAAAAASATSARRYDIDEKSTTSVDMPGLQEHIKAETTSAAGTLDVVPTDLSQSRGLVRVDLATLSTHTFNDENKNATQTKHARTWLEAVVDGKVNDGLRWAEFAIRSIADLSASDLRTVSPVKDGAQETRTVTMMVHGDLLLHGHTLPKEDLVEVTFHYPAGSPPTARPASVDVRSKEPLHVVLKEHDVSPRDPAGQLLAWTANLVSKVADTADVRVALTATPAP